MATFDQAAASIPDEELEESESSLLAPYEIVSSPNDFNLETLYNFIKRGVVKIPGFQRNYVWDLKRASKLMESILIGLPIPQIFLYEEKPNSFLVIDGQQRLMSVYYFREGRFPRADKRPELRRIYDQNGDIPEGVFQDDRYFAKFRLQLAANTDGTPNRYHGLTYDGFSDELKGTFDLRTIRNVIIKQLQPREDDSSSVYEIFNRLNTGGVNLRPQEIRSSLYRSRFINMLGRVNEAPEWRRLFGSKEPDVHLQDVQYLLRSFAVLAEAESYSPSMVRFLDRFSAEARKFSAEKVAYLEELALGFLRACANLPENAMGVRGRTLSITVLEAVFWAACHSCYEQQRVPGGSLDPARLELLRQDAQFVEKATGQTTHSANLRRRIELASQFIAPLPPA
ncbi:MAG: DUF262 domain-containing protein [Terriglobales bacterium]